MSVWLIGCCAIPDAPQARILASLGVGATLGHGRWHMQSPLRMVYASASRALCRLEKQLHCKGAAPRNQLLMRLDLPDAARLSNIIGQGLPSDWRHNQAATQALGMAWLQGGDSLGLWVPSLIEPAEQHLLLNPTHPQYRDIRLSIECAPLRLNPRQVLQSCSIASATASRGPVNPTTGSGSRYQ